MSHVLEENGYQTYENALDKHQDQFGQKKLGKYNGHELYLNVYEYYSYENASDLEFRFTVEMEDRCVRVHLFTFRSDEVNIPVLEEEAKRLFTTIINSDNKLK